MTPETYRPPPEEMAHAEEMMTPEQQAASREREAVLESLGPPTFQEKAVTAILDIDEQLLHLERVQPLADQKGFEKKDEFHLTILGFKNGRAILKALKTLPDEERHARLAEVRELVQNTEWRLGSGGTLYHISKEYRQPDPKAPGGEIVEQREAYVQLLDLQGIDHFYAELNRLLGLDLKSPPTHLTLYTKGTDPKQSKMGIGIETWEDWEKLNPQPVEFTQTERGGEMERAEIERRVREAIARNQEVLTAVPETASVDEFWEALRGGQSLHLRVSRPEGGPDQESTGIYPLEEDGDQIEITFFAPDGKIGERYWIELARIKFAG